MGEDDFLVMSPVLARVVVESQEWRSDAVENSPRPYETPRRPTSDEGLKKEQNNRPWSEQPPVLYEGADDPRAVFDYSCGVRGGRGWTLLVDRRRRASGTSDCDGVPRVCVGTCPVEM